MSFTPGPGTTYVAIQKPATLADIGALAAASALSPQTIYYDTATGYRFVAQSPTNFISLNTNLNAAEVNFVESGLLIPASGTIAAATLTSGVAWVDGVRVALAGGVLSLTATRDNYIDLRRDGVVIVTPVAVSTTAPAIPANSIRLGFCTTNATNVTARSISAFDNIGNWMYNTSSKPFCRLRSSTTQGTGGVLTAVNFPEADLADNAAMHDPALNATRITFPSNGLYQISCTVAFTASFTNASSTMALYARLDGTTVSESFPQGIISQNVASNGVGTSGVVDVRAGQYLEMLFAPNGPAGLALAAAWLTCAKIS